MKTIVRQLKNLNLDHINPRQEWLESNRAVLLSQIKNTITEHSKFTRKKSISERVWLGMSVFLPRTFVFNVVRPVVATILVVVLGAGSWIATVAASQDSLPGEWLYSAKVVTEKTQMAAVSAVGAKETETSLRVDFAKRRATEARQLINSNDPEKIKKAPEVVGNLKQEIGKVGENLKQIKQEESVSKKVSASTVKSVNEKTQEIKNILKEAETSLVASINATSTASKDLSLNLAEVKGMAGQTSVTAMEVLVDKHVKGDDSVSKEEVKEVINDQIKSLSSGAVENKNILKDLEKETEKIANSSSTLSVGVNTSTSTLATSTAATNLEQASKKAREAVTKVEEVSKEVDKKVAQTQQLLSQDNLVQAAQKVREASDASSQAEQAASKAIKDIQTVAPAVVANVVKEVKEVMATSTASVNLRTTTSATGSAVFGNSTSTGVKQ